MKNQLTRRQEEYAMAILSLWRENLHPPTTRELGKKMKVSQKSAWNTCNILIEKGFLKKSLKFASPLVPADIKIDFQNGGCYLFWGRKSILKTNFENRNSNRKVVSKMKIEIENEIRKLNSETENENQKSNLENENQKLNLENENER